MKNRNNIVVVLTTLVVTLASGCSSVDYAPWKKPDEELKLVLSRHNSGAYPPDCQPQGHSDCRQLSADLQRLLLDQPEHQPTQVVASWVYQQMGKTRQAQPLLDNVIVETTPPLISLIMRTELAISEGNLTLARKLTDKAILLYGTTPEPYLQRAGIDFVTGEYVSAEDFLNRALRLGLSEGVYYYHLGLLSHAREETDQACRFYQYALSFTPPNRSLITSRLASLQHLPNCESGL